MSWLGRATILAALLVAGGCGDTRRTNVDAGPVVPRVDAGAGVDAGGIVLEIDAGPTSNTYATCFEPDECLAALDQCLDVDIPAAGTGGSYCSRGCTADAECPARGDYDGVCYSLDGSSSVCYQQCDFDRDCQPGSVCIEVSLDASTVDFICVPNN